jgi:arsenite methyltransferase
MTDPTREMPMTDRTREQSEDVWSSWVVSRAYGADPEETQRRAPLLHLIRDRVLDGAGLRQGDVVLDVGAGDGLISFGALPLVGESGRVVISDISPQLLEVCRERAQQDEVEERCHLVLAAAEDLAPIGDGSVDAVTVRSVLIYVAAKRDAFASFHRVLRSGGRLSMFEPINRFLHPEPAGTFWGYDVAPVADLAARVGQVYRRARPATGPMLGFDERDLLRLAEETGFSEVHLRLHVDVEPRKEPMPSQTFARTAPNPLAPTFEEAVREALRPSEARRLQACLRPLVLEGRGSARSAGAYLSAVKHAAPAARR